MSSHQAIRDPGTIITEDAFERAGGYAAGFATGLLECAQVYWDPNRQGIHDKIAGTVVVREGEPRLSGPWRTTAKRDSATPREASGRGLDDKASGS